MKIKEVLTTIPAPPGWYAELAPYEGTTQIRRDRRIPVVAWILANASEDGDDWQVWYGVAISRDGEVEIAEEIKGHSVEYARYSDE